MAGPSAVCEKEACLMEYDCLMIDDEKLLADSTAEYFNLFGVSTAVVYSAGECRSFWEKNRARLMLLDINLGDGSGFDLCRELRQRTDVPILFISAGTSDDDKIVALHIGGDDYVQKPYSLSVLLAKVKAVLKRQSRYQGACSRETFAGSAAEEMGRNGIFGDGRGSGGMQTQYCSGSLTIDFPAKQVLVEGRSVRLTALEFRLLAYLVRNEGRVISKQELFEQVWEDKFTGDGTLNVHIRKLREAIEHNPGSPKYILTVWGDGYRFCGEQS